VVNFGLIGTARQPSNEAVDALKRCMAPVSRATDIDLEIPTPEALAVAGAPTHWYT
jgi:hypothetical protein